MNSFVWIMHLFCIGTHPYALGQVPLNEPKKEKKNAKKTEEAYAKNPQYS